jgi:hypothetical protein
MLAVVTFAFFVWDLPREYMPYTPGSPWEDRPAVSEALALTVLCLTASAASLSLWMWRRPGRLRRIGGIVAVLALTVFAYYLAARWIRHSPALQQRHGHFELLDFLTWCCLCFQWVPMIWVRWRKHGRELLPLADGIPEERPACRWLT